MQGAFRHEDARIELVNESLKIDLLEEAKKKSAETGKSIYEVRMIQIII